MAESVGTVLPRLVALSAGATFGFLFFGPLGMFIGALLGLLVVVTMGRREA